MALMECRECGYLISGNATTCPRCGVKIDKKRGFFKFHLIISLTMFGVALFLVGLYSSRPITPEEQAAADNNKKWRAYLGELTTQSDKEVKKRAELKAALPDLPTKEAENFRKGFHCLSSWNGSHREVVARVKSVLNDPDSFEHDETKVTPVENGVHQILMKYRATNGFGAVVRGAAIGTFAQDDCNSVTITQVQ